jgi:hypothetical protein
VPSAAIVARSACAVVGLTRTGADHVGGSAPRGERWTYTPIVGLESVAHFVVGGGQSVAQADRSRVELAASERPGVQL